MVIEDKAGLKRHSLSGNGPVQALESIEAFSYKIAQGKKAQVADPFMIVAKIEALMAGHGVGEALQRAAEYIAAGADGLMIHGRDTDAGDVAEFCAEYGRFAERVPLIASSTCCPQLGEGDLRRTGFSVVVHENQLLRAAYPAMRRCAERILLDGRTLAAEEACMPVRDLLDLVPGG